MMKAVRMMLPSQFYLFLFGSIVVQTTIGKDCGDGIIRGVNLGKLYLRIPYHQLTSLM